MASFILLEPSSDIHLVLDPLFPQQNLSLRVFGGHWNGQYYDIQTIAPGQDLQFDLFPTAQTILQLNGTNQLVPKSPGTVLMQVRYMDPMIPGDYHYLLARIQVHEKLDGWWFGNNSLSVFLNPDLAHSQVSIYALFDSHQPGGGVVADITGHGYVTLTSVNPAICQIDQSIPAGHQYRDRIRGLQVGSTRIKGSLLGQDAFLTTTVVDLKTRATDPPHIPLLDRGAMFDFTVPRGERHNILFLAEGFSIADQALFRQAVTKISHDLFALHRHSPYYLLKDKFNIWSAFRPSLESGVTVRSQLAMDGSPIPEDALPAGSPPNSYSLLEFLQIVGLPTPQDATTPIHMLRAQWNDPNGIYRQWLGYDDALLTPDIFEYWKKLVPKGIPQAADSYYGLSQGTRWGDRLSVQEARTDMVSIPAANDPMFKQRMTQFAQRVYQWYKPEDVVRNLGPDPRRFAPEYSKSNALRLLMSHIQRLADPQILDVTDPNYLVGQYWNRKWQPPLNSNTRHYNSAGLVCFIVKHEYYGGTAIPGFFVQASLGSATRYTTRLDPAQVNTKRLEMAPTVQANYSRVVDTLAHEFGHSFNLGDEYEEVRASGEFLPERFDNLTHLDRVGILEDPAHPFDKNYPDPIAADQIKWADLPRIEHSSMLVKNSEVVNGKVTLTLGPNLARQWYPIKSLNLDVFLWRQTLNLKTYNLRLNLEKSFADCHSFTLDSWSYNASSVGPYNFNTFTELAAYMKRNDVQGDWKFDGVDSIIGGDPGTNYGSLKITAHYSAPKPDKQISISYVPKINQLPVTPADVLTFKIDAIPDAQTIVLAGDALSAVFPAGSLLYLPKRDTNGNPLTLVEQPVQDYLKNTSWNPGDSTFPKGVALTENHDPGNPQTSDPVSEDIDTPPPLPNFQAPCHPQRLLGLYEGGGTFTRAVYRASGDCKMRRSKATASSGNPVAGQFCFLCQYLLVNRIDPGKHKILDQIYYPDSRCCCQG